MAQNQENNDFVKVNKKINLYARDGNKKEVETNENGELFEQDLQWLNEHGGSLPLSQIPDQDKAFVKQSEGNFNNENEKVDVNDPLTTLPFENRGFAQNIKLLDNAHAFQTDNKLK